MSILDELSSQIGDRTEYSNRKLAIRCQDNASLLKEIAGGLANGDAALAGDCAEVMAAGNREWIGVLVPGQYKIAGVADPSGFRKPEGSWTGDPGSLASSGTSRVVDRCAPTRRALAWRIDNVPGI